MTIELARQKRRKGSMNSRSRKLMLSPVQHLYETCSEVFADGKAGFVPPPKDIERLRSVLDNLKPENVGLSADMPYFRATGSDEVPPPVTYLHIYECDKFSIGIFCLPPSGVIPLHNHPGMTVFSKLLFGSMHIKSYDWVADVSYSKNQNTHHEDLAALQHEPRLAKVHADSDLTAPCKTSVLYPNAGGNMHCFTALTPCAMLDVLGPPYSDDEGRHCTYYNDFPYATFSGDTGSLQAEEMEGCGWLKEMEKPESFVVVGAMYRGPQFVEN
ncbi:plant cysteine oxidase 2 [Vitis vinifera]|nr:plant cysteine oxidase 2 [Vitis vinifera]CAN63139.1 hypothetical protein VITISV_034572 [Vitis vinifera]|eukprot:XP_010663397.1 PREDICTED: plant cysteine oxidase 2 [Vitis vinifera]